MIIANPIYDVVFKSLMENERIAKFFISTLLDVEIESVEMKPQEFTYTKELIGLSVFRLDFIAVIKLENGESKKVLIEIQKASNQIDLMRFRNYLAEQYKKEDKVNGKKEILPITTIYILGFNLKNIESACLHVERQYVDLIENQTITEKSEFVEKLTHDSYVVQVGRIQDRFKTRLDKVLSVFEQANFVDDDQIIKEYLHQTDVEELKLMTDLLHHTGTDPATKKEIETEKEAWRTVYALFGEKEKELIEELEKKDKKLEEQQRLIEELQNKLNSK